MKDTVNPTRRAFIASAAASSILVSTPTLSQTPVRSIRLGSALGNDVCSIRDFKRERWLPGHEHGAVVTNERSRDGQSSLRLELRYGDCGRMSDGSHSDCSHGNERVEFSAYSPRQGEGDVFRYGWNAYFPSSFPSSSFSGATRPEILLGQFHDSNGWVFALFYGGWRPGNGGLMVKGPFDGSNFHGAWRSPVLPRSAMFGGWNDIFVDVKWTKQSNGFFRVGVNGSFVANYEGRTLMRGSSIFFKLGIYRLDTMPTAGTAVVYYDRIFRERLQG